MLEVEEDVTTRKNKISDGKNKIPHKFLGRKI